MKSIVDLITETKFSNNLFKLKSGDSIVLYNPKNKKSIEVKIVSTDVLTLFDGDTDGFFYIELEKNSFNISNVNAPCKIKLSNTKPVGASSIKDRNNILYFGCTLEDIQLLLKNDGYAELDVINNRIKVINDELKSLMKRRKELENIMK